jgi:hypothetical protein
MTHLRRKAKNLVVNQRTIYKCELENCPTCGESLADCRHYSWSKTVQQLDQVIHVASQPKECRNPKCKDVGKRYVSAVAQTIALPGATYGLDVVAQIGWWKDREHLSGTEIYQRLSGKVKIGRRQIDILTYTYRILMACAIQKQEENNLAMSVQDYGGVIISLDGLEPEGAQEQLWVVREVLTGCILAVAWLPRVNQTTLIELLTPVEQWLKSNNYPLLATVSDKQGAVRVALNKVWQEVRHQWCQAHYLRNAAKPLQTLDHALKTDLRKDIREEIRTSLGQVGSTAENGAFSPSTSEWVSSL